MRSLPPTRPTAVRVNACTELSANTLLQPGRGPIRTANPFQLRSLPLRLAAISGRFSSSLPPPSFARGASQPSSFRQVLHRAAPATPRFPLRPSGPERCAASRSSARAFPGCRSLTGWPTAPRSRCSRPAAYFGGHTHTVDVTLDGRHARRRHRLPGASTSAPTRTCCGCSQNSASRSRRRTCRSRFRCRTAGSNGAAATWTPSSRSVATCCARVLAACWPTSCASTAATTALARTGSEAALRRADRRLPGRAPLQRRLPRLVLPADDRLHLVVPDRPDAALPGRDDGPLLPQPRPAADRRPAAVVHRARRRAALCGEDAAPRRPTRAEHAGAAACARIPPGSGAAGVLVSTDAGTERFDDVVLACHSDQALALLADARADEREVLGRDPLPREPRRAAHRHRRCCRGAACAWAAWNYERAADGAREQAAVCLHYLINRLQPLPFRTPVVVSLNPLREPRAETVLGRLRLRPPGVRHGGDRGPERAARTAGGCATPGSAAPGRATASTKTA